MENTPNRLTLNNPVSEMTRTELWMNNCFAKDGWAMYRDFDGESDLRQFIKRVAEDMGVKINVDYDDEYFCDMMCDWLEDGLDSKTGLLAFLYHMMTSKAELYEHLKGYEDAEESGLLLTAPCKPGDDLYWVSEGVNGWQVDCVPGGIKSVDWDGKEWRVGGTDGEHERIGTRFCCLTREQAEEWLENNVKK